MEDLLTLEARLDVDVSDYSLLAIALTHRSYLNENDDVGEDNERLEFLGDAVIDLIVADYLYSRYPDMSEGEMTSLRAALVRAETLARFSKQVGVNEALRLGQGEEENGGRRRKATLCAAFEAVIGALYLDIGFMETKKLIENIIADELTHILANDSHKDARSEFQVWSQARFNATPTYQVVDTSGPDHAREFTVQVVVDESVWGEGKGRSKQLAAHAAAREAMNRVAENQEDSGYSE